MLKYCIIVVYCEWEVHMNTTYFKYFVEVVDSGSIAAAASELYISRQSLTTAINNLEAELGNIKLLTRRSTGVEVTPAGALFYQRAKEQLTLLQATMDELRQIEKTSAIKMCMPLFRLDELDIKEIISFEHQHSPLNVECHDMTYGQCRKSIISGAMDAGLVYRSPKDRHIFDYAAVAPADFCILMRRDHPAAQLDQVAFKDISGSTLLFIYGLEFLSPAIQQQVMEHDVTINCIPRNHSVLMSSLKAGKGLHFMPRLFAPLELPEEIVCKPFTLFPEVKQFAIAYLKESPYQVVEFAKHIAEILKGLYQKKKNCGR